MKKKPLSYKVLDKENSAVAQFLFDCVIPKAGNRLPVRDLFVAYGAWRKTRMMPPSPLTIDGFGHLFPKFFVRKVMWLFDEKLTLNSVLGIGIKKC